MTDIPKNATHCPRCPNWWTGLTPGHCTGCCRTFSGITAFDAHRKAGKCQEPEDVGLVRMEKPWVGWGFPGSRPFPEDDE